MRTAPFGRRGVRLVDIAGRPHDPVARPRRSAWRAVLGGAIGLLAAMATAAGTVSAHTDFVGSIPADGGVASGPLTEITLEFTAPAEPSGDGFRVLDPAGVVRAPTSVDPTDGTVFVLSFDPPLTDGTYAVAWEVRAGDSHPIDGTFRFEIVGAPTTVATTTTIAATTTIAMPESTPPTTAATETDAAGTTSTTIAGVATTAPSTTVALDDFLGSTGSSGGDTLGAFGRIASFAGLLAAIGVVTGLLWVVRGRRDELVGLVGLLRWGGLLILAGGVVEIVALRSRLDEPLGDVLATEAGLAGMLTVAGGAVLWLGARGDAGTIRPPSRPLSAAVTAPDVARRDDSTPESRGYRWVPTAAGSVALAGIALAVAARWFDGHTANRGPRAVHAAVDTVHVVAAGCWAGTVLVMAVVAWRRRGDRAGDLAPMIGRFSLPATVSLVAVTAAGIVMMLMITDDIGQLTSTDWGRLYLVKVAAVAVAAGLGGFHRFRVHPMLESAAHDRASAATARRLLVIESAVFAVVVAVTAWLVTAAV